MHKNHNYIDLFEYNYSEEEKNKLKEEINLPSFNVDKWYTELVWFLSVLKLFLKECDLILCIFWRR